MNQRSIPEGAGVFQLRYGQGSEGLHLYPSGKSAMAYYGGGDQIDRAISQLRVRVDDSEWERLSMRYYLTFDWKPELSRLLDQFIARFGAAPLLNSR